MRAIFSLLSLLVVLALVGWLAKKQVSPAPSGTQSPASAASAQPGSAQQQSQMVQDQFKKSLEEAMQTPRNKEAQ